MYANDNAAHPHEIEEQFGPFYPDLGAGVAKFRRIPRNKITKVQRLAYGEAVHRAILAKQRSELQRELPSFKPRCASGTWHADGDKIHAAIQQQQAARLQAAVAQDRKRTPAQWKTAYDAAMQDQRRRAEADNRPRARQRVAA
jgi:hypothetical protein